MENEDEELFHTCRACLSLSNNTCSIFELTSQSNIDAVTMLELFSLEVKADDDLPKTFCKSCFNKLQAGYSFVETFKRSQQFLMQYYLNKCEENIMVVSEEYELSDHFEDDNLAAINVHTVTNSSSNEDETEERFIIKCEENNQDFLIEQSVDNSRKLSDDVAKKNLDLDKFKTTKRIYFSCPLCPKTFKRFHFFGSHLKQHNREIKCKLCAMQFDDADIYLAHYRLKHRFQCDICNKSFPRRDTYNRHMQVHNNSLPQFVCPADNCSKTFTVRQSLRNHFSTIHSEKRNFLCNLCGTSFKNYDNLRYHMKKHNGPSHLCTYCGKTFMQSVHLKYHMWKHTGVKPYTCTKCDKSFVSKKVLTAHLERNCEKSKRKRAKLFSNTY